MVDKISSTAVYLGVDVGTGSARAALLDGEGNVLTSASQESRTWRDSEDPKIFEQSTEDIWAAVTISVQRCITAIQSLPGEYHVEGIGFDATCSLAVVTLEDGDPVCVSKSGTRKVNGDPVRNVILWADHRAKAEAEDIDFTQAAPLAFVGDKMSLEMELPKLLWLKRNMPQSLFDRCEFFDLPDYLTYKATGNRARSMNSLGSKFSFIPDKGWDDDMMMKLGLGELKKRDYVQLGPGTVLTAGMTIGNGLSPKVAKEWGIKAGTPVGSAVIDAYAGWIGTAAASIETDKIAPTIDSCSTRLCVIAGTSTCHIVQSAKPITVHGVWGPYRDACMANWYMNEGGQSCTGQLLEFVLKSHPAYPILMERARKEEKNEFVVLSDILLQLKLKEKVSSVYQLVRGMNMYPDMHGNRSPLADNNMRGMMNGLSMDSSIHDLARKYQLTLESIALQTKHIIMTLNNSGHNISSIFMSGGQVKNRELMQLFADVCDMPVILPPSSSTSVVAGAAILGKYAAMRTRTVQNSMHPTIQLWDMMTKMTLPAERISPSCLESDKKLLAVKYDMFLESISIQQRWRKMIDSCD